MRNKIVKIVIPVSVLILILLLINNVVEHIQLKKAVRIVKITCGSNGKISEKAMLFFRNNETLFISALIELIKDKDVDYATKTVAIISLVELKDTRAVHPLIDLLNDNDWRVRFLVAEALGDIGSIKAIPNLSQAWREECQNKTPNAWTIQREIATALIKIGDKKEPISAKPPFFVSLWEGLKRDSLGRDSPGRDIAPA